MKFYAYVKLFQLDEWLTDVAVLLSFIDADDLLPLTIVTGLSAFNVNMDKLKKMHNLWEPPTHPVLYLGHTTAVFALLEVMSVNVTPFIFCALYRFCTFFCLGLPTNTKSLTNCVMNFVGVSESFHTRDMQGRFILNIFYKKI